MNVKPASLVNLLTYLFGYQRRVWSLRRPACSRRSLMTLLISGDSERPLRPSLQTFAVTYYLSLHVNLTGLDLTNIWFLFMFYCCVILDHFALKACRIFLVFLFCNIHMQSGYCKKGIYHLFANFFSCNMNMHFNILPVQLDNSERLECVKWTCLLFSVHDVVCILIVRSLRVTVTINSFLFYLINIVLNVE